MDTKKAINLLIPKIPNNRLIHSIHSLLHKLVGHASHWLWSLYDSCPPYEILDGQLDMKERSADGRYVMSLRNNWLEIDKQTYDVLVAGEFLRVRCTRGRRAVSIDRIVSGRGPG